MFRSIGSGRHDRCAGAHKIAYFQRRTRLRITAPWLRPPLTIVPLAHAATSKVRPLLTIVMAVSHRIRPSDLRGATRSGGAPARCLARDGVRTRRSLRRAGRRKALGPATKLDASM